jgi:hypothetical protein
MIKWIGSENEPSKLDSQILNELSYLKGKSLYQYSLNKIEKQLKEKFTAIDSIQLSRSWPHQIKIRYQTRIPIAVLKDNPAVIDDQGVVFSFNDVALSMTSSTATTGNLPQLSFVSTATLTFALSFLKTWNRIPSDLSACISPASLRKINVDELGEISFILQDLDPAAQAETRIVWGDFNPETFHTKWSRFQEVCQDLQKKSLKAQSINLRDVPQKYLESSTDPKIVGRVIVRLYPPFRKTVHGKI